MYKNGKTVGKGAFGKCKIYYSEKYGKKVIEKRIVTAKNQIEKLFQKEAGFMALLKLTKIDCCVEIFDFNLNPPSIIMEYCEGGDLRKIINRNELSDYDKLVFIDQILKALEKIHNFGIIHGDLKCSNIYLKNNYKQNEKNQIKIGDFGLSEMKGGLVKGGTPGFWTPEIQRGYGGSIILIVIKNCF